MLWFILPRLCEICHCKKDWPICRKYTYIGIHVKYTLFLSDFNETWIYSTYFLKILQYQISRKSVEREPSFSCRLSDGWTDTRDEANSHLFTILQTRIVKDKCFSPPHCLYTLFLSDFSETWIFSTHFLKILNIKFHENPSRGSLLVHADGPTDGQTRVTKLIVACLQFYQRP